MAATGAAFAGAKLEVLDQRGVLVCEKTTLSDGSYACELPEDAKAPLVIRATREDQVLYSTTASVAGGTVNITPLTTIIAAQLAPNGDPSRLAAAIQADASVVSEGAIRTEVQALLAVLKPLLEALGQSDLD
ncbi:MAG: carboxypeptidase regulatory-like domain-containing protein, partial [Comamonadaceae bacterium]